MKIEQLKSRIEAVLFITARAVSLDEIAVILGEEKETIEEAILELIMDYSTRDGALEIDDENGYILQVKEDYMDLVELLCQIAQLEGVTVKGLMSIPPICDNKHKISNYFHNMHKLFIDISQKKLDNIYMTILSMGMSADYYEAILEGANMVRIGSALFGARNYT